MPIEQLIRQEFRFTKTDRLPLYPRNESADREFLAKVLAKGGMTRGAEIGVLMGQFSEVLCRNIPGLKLTCVDPWLPYSNWPKPGRMERFFENAKKRLNGYDVEFLRMTSLEGAKRIKDESLDFCYIDALHDFDSVIQDIIAWVPKVRMGGVVAGHDFGPGPRVAVAEAVTAYAHAHGISNLYLTRQCDKDLFPSWFWVKRLEYA